MSKCRIIYWGILIAIIGIIFSLSVWAKSDEPVSSSSINTPKVGYGVHDLTIKNPLTDCRIIMPTSVEKDKPVKIYFATTYDYGTFASGSFLHDGWHKASHRYETSIPKYSWSISNSKGRALASGILTKGNSITFTPKEIGTIQVKCTAMCKCSPSPKYAYVGITQWTKTLMPTVSFQKVMATAVCPVEEKAHQAAPPSEKSDEEPALPKPVTHWLTPSVEHTSLWENRRKDFNKDYGYSSSALSQSISLSKYMKKPDPRPRYANVYWSGEKLILSAKADKMTTSIKASIPGTQYSTYLHRENGKWIGALWSPSMKEFWSGNRPTSVTIDFLGQCQDGKTLKRSLDIIISGNIFSDTLHRVI